MNKQNAIKHFRPQIIMAIYGAVLFAAITMVVAFTGSYPIGQPSLFGAIQGLLCAPAERLIRFSELVYILPDNFVYNDRFLVILALILNPILGAMLFVFVGSFLRFIIKVFSGKGDHEK